MAKIRTRHSPVWTDATIKGAQTRYKRVAYAARRGAADGLAARLGEIVEGAGDETQAYAKAQGELSMLGGREITMAGNKTRHFYSALCWFAIAGELERARAAWLEMDKEAAGYHDGESYRRGARFILRAIEYPSSVLYDPCINGGAPLHFPAGTLTPYKRPIT